jgi:hypothetical protein
MEFADVNWNPDRKQLRVFAALWLIAFGALGLHMAWRSGALGGQVPIGWHDPWRGPLGLWALAVSVSLVGLAFPGAIRPIYKVWMAAAFPIGWTVSHVLLGVVYFGLFTAFSLIFKMLGRDPLKRSFDRQAPTYWTRRPVGGGPQRYFRQF